MSDVPTIYADDPDAYVEFRVTDTTGQDLSWTPMVAFDGGDYTTEAVWQGPLGSTRVLRVPVDSGMSQTTHTVYLRITGGTDQSLGQFYVAARR